MNADGTESMEMLPKNHRFRLTYKGCDETKQSDSVTVTFQMHLVHVELRDNDGNLVPNSGAIIKYQPGSSGSYIDFGDGLLDADGTESMEVLPKNH